MFIEFTAAGCRCLGKKAHILYLEDHSVYVVPWASWELHDSVRFFVRT